MAWNLNDIPLNEILAANLPELLSPEEKLVWLLGDLMNAVENYFGAKNPKRLGHINSSAIRILDDVIQPLRERIAALDAALEKIATEDDGLPTYTPQAMVVIAKRALNTGRTR